MKNINWEEMGDYIIEEVIWDNDRLLLYLEDLMEEDNENKFYDMKKEIASRIKFAFSNGYTKMKALDEYEGD